MSQHGHIFIKKILHHIVYLFHQCMTPTETHQYISVTVPLFICLLFFLLVLKEYSLSQDATFCHDKRPPQWMRPLFVCPEKHRVLSRSIQSGCIVLKPFRPSASQVGQCWKPCGEQDVEACLALWPLYIFSLYPVERLIQLSHTSIWQ